MTARDDAAAAGKAAGAVLAVTQHAILTAMAREAALVIRGTVPSLLAKRRFETEAAVELGRASAALRGVYAQAVRDVTGKDGPLPDAPDQVASAVLRAQHDAGVAFGAVLFAALGPGNGVRTPPPSSPYRRIADSARRQGTPGKAAVAAIAAIERRGLAGWTDRDGRRVPLAVYGQRAVRAATEQTARMPALPEITARRDALLARHTAAVSAAWDRAAAGLDVAQAVRAFRSDSRLSSGAGNPTVAERWRKEAAEAAALALLAGIYRTDGWTALLAAIEAMTEEGMAEGEADALLLAATRQKVAGFSTGAAFAWALAQLAGDMSAGRQARESAAGIVAAVAAAVARALAASRDDEDEDEAEEDAGEALRGPAVSRWADWALWAALGTGAVALYRRLAGFGSGLTVLIDWNDTASACALCSQNASGSPYTPDSVPPYPGHGACRCWLSSEAQLPLSLLSQFAGLF